MAIDRETVLEGAYFGVMEPSYGVAAKGAPGYMDSPPVERDVEGAKALLEEAGLTEGANNKPAEFVVERAFVG